MRHRSHARKIEQDVVMVPKPDNAGHTLQWDAMQGGPTKQGKVHFVFRANMWNKNRGRHGPLPPPRQATRDGPPSEVTTVTA